MKGMHPELLGDRYYLQSCGLISCALALLRDRLLEPSCLDSSVIFKSGIICNQLRFSRAMGKIVSIADTDLIREIKVNLIRVNTS